MHIVDKLRNVSNVKQELSSQLSRLGQDTSNVKFRNYSNLIENIPSSSVISQSNIDNFVIKTININGENA